VIPAQGDIWWAESEDKRRPILVLTRSEAIPVLHRIMVAPITRTVRGIPTEVPFDEEDGLPGPCAAAFDNLMPLPKTFLTGLVSPGAHRRQQICTALSALADCR